MRMRSLSLLALLALLIILTPPAADAHGTHVGPSQTFTQVVGPIELAITLENTAAAPGPLYLLIAPQGDIGDALIQLRAAPRGRSLDQAPAVEVGGVPDPQGMFYAEIYADQTGDWELEVRTSGS